MFSGKQGSLLVCCCIASFVGMAYMTDWLTYALVRFGCFRGGVREDLGRDHTPMAVIVFAVLSKRKMRNRHRERPAGRACCFVTAPCYRWVSCLCSVDVCASVVGLCYLPLFYCDFHYLWLVFFQRFSLLCDLQKKLLWWYPHLVDF